MKTRSIPRRILNRPGDRLRRSAGTGEFCFADIARFREKSLRSRSRRGVREVELGRASIASGEPDVGHPRAGDTKAASRADERTNRAAYVNVITVSEFSSPSLRSTMELPATQLKIATGYTLEPLSDDIH